MPAIALRGEPLERVAPALEHTGNPPVVRAAVAAPALEHTGNPPVVRAGAAAGGPRAVVVTMLVGHSAPDGRMPPASPGRGMCGRLCSEDITAPTDGGPDGRGLRPLDRSPDH